MSAAVLKKLRTKFKRELLDAHDRLGNETIIVAPDSLRTLMQWLISEPKMEFDMLADVTAVDYLDRDPRYEVVYNLYSTSMLHRLRVRVPLQATGTRLPTVSDLWRSALWGEREVWDMFGIHFENHPDLRRILMYEEFEGHPLRKDYPVQQSQPRMDLRRKERDAVEEYQHFHVDKIRPPAG
jgi:NADH-quinone oxidoreductase subunit C